ALLAALHHLHVCSACRAQIETAGATEARVVALRAALAADAQLAAAHLGYEQLADYVDETLVASERQLADEHLVACEFCLFEVRSLAELRAQLATQPVWQSPALSWRERLNSLWQLPIWRVRPLASLAATILLIALGATWLSRHSATSTRNELAQITPLA